MVKANELNLYDGILRIIEAGNKIREHENYELYKAKWIPAGRK
jgi:hypothetical protein